MVDARTAGGWQFENTILGRSLTGDFATDVYRLRGGLAPVEGRYQLRIRENEQEHTTLDRVWLWAVDHEPGEHAFATANGVLLGERRPARRITTSDGRDVTHLLDGTSGMFQGRAGDTLVVELTAPSVAGAFAAEPGDSGEGLLEEPCCEKDRPGFARAGTDPSVDRSGDAAWLTRTGVVIQVPDGTGAWRTLQHRYPREREDQVGLELAGQERVRLIFQGRQRLAFVGRVVRTREARPLELPLRQAWHTRLGNQLSVVSGERSTTTLDPGDTLSLEFDATPVPEGKVRDLFLVSTGVYTSDLTGAHESEPATLPTRIALAQNRPNPFSKSTAIHFEVPAPARIRLEVFDLSGRRVAMLADAEYPAGYHAVEWNRRGASGTAVKSGVYVYRLSAGEYQEQRKMILLP